MFEKYTIERKKNNAVLIVVKTILVIRTYLHICVVIFIVFNISLIIKVLYDEKANKARFE